MKKTPEKEKDVQTITLSSFKYMPTVLLLKDRASYQELGYDRSAVYIEF